MTAMPPLRDILNDSPANAIHVDFNFQTIENHLATEVINRDGTVAMTGPLTLSGPPTSPVHAATKQYVDSAVPVGAIWMWGGDALPAGGGWAWCDGAEKTQTDPAYQALFAVIGTKYGVGAAGSFKLPNFKARIPLGFDSPTGDAIANTLGQTGGTKNATTLAHSHPIAGHSHGTPGHQHTTPAISAFQTGDDFPNHAHNVTGDTTLYAYDQDGTGSNIAVNTPPNVPMNWAQLSSFQTLGTPTRHKHQFDWPGQTTVAGQGAGTTSSQSGGTATDNAGAGDGTNANLPPYLVVNFIIRIG